MDNDVIICHLEQYYTFRILYHDMLHASIQVYSWLWSAVHFISQLQIIINSVFVVAVLFSVATYVWPGGFISHSSHNIDEFTRMQEWFYDWWCKKMFMGDVMFMYTLKDYDLIESGVLILFNWVDYLQ